MLSEEYHKRSDALIDICLEKGFSEDAIMMIGILCCCEEMEETVGSIEEGIARVTEFAKTAKTPEEIVAFADKLSNGEIQ